MVFKRFLLWKYRTHVLNLWALVLWKAMERNNQENTFFKKINLGSLRLKQLLKDPLLAPSFFPNILRDNSSELLIFRSLQKVQPRPRGHRGSSAVQANYLGQFIPGQNNLQSQFPGWDKRQGESSGSAASTNPSRSSRTPRSAPAPPAKLMNMIIPNMIIFGNKKHFRNFFLSFFF